MPLEHKWLRHAYADVAKWQMMVMMEVMVIMVMLMMEVMVRVLVMVVMVMVRMRGGGGGGEGGKEEEKEEKEDDERRKRIKRRLRRKTRKRRRRMRKMRRASDPVNTSRSRVEASGALLGALGRSWDLLRNIRFFFGSTRKPVHRRERLIPHIIPHCTISM